MQIAGEPLGTLIWRALTDPAAVAAKIVKVRYDRATLWSAVALVTVLTALAMALTQFLAPTTPPPGVVMPSPLSLTAMLGFFLVAMILAVYFTGRVLGGTGKFSETLLLMTWFQFMTLVITPVQLVLSILFPFLSGFLSVMGVALWLFWLMHIINVLHGFNNLFKAFATFAIGVLGLAFGLAMVLALFGVNVQGGVV
jgi:hypothetical protein